MPSSLLCSATRFRRRGMAATPTGCPHLAQKFWPGSRVCPHPLQNMAASKRTNGSTQISDLRRGALRSHEANVLHAGVMRQVYDIGNILEINAGVAFDESNFFSAGSENLLQSGGEFSPLDGLFVDFQSWRRARLRLLHLDHNRARRWWRAVRGFLRNLGLQPSFRRRDHQENDDKRS